MTKQGNAAVRARGRDRKTTSGESGKRNHQRGGVITKETGFIKVPKALLSESYQGISAAAKLLYIELLDLTTLSEKNGLVDEYGTYVYCSIQQAQALLHCGHDKATGLFRQLESAGLIRRTRQGLGKTCRIYPQCADFQHWKSAVQNAEVSQSAVRESRSQDCGKSDTINTENINTEIIYTQSIDPDRWVERIKEQIDYSILAEKYDLEQLEEIVSIMADVMRTTEPTLRINRSNIATATAQERYAQLDFTHIEYVMDCLRQNTKEITNVRAYLMTALYNATGTINTYYQAQINHNEAC